MDENLKEQTMEKKIAIIGAGPGGYSAAVRAAQLGASVTLVEKESVGGTCLNWGCIPSKVMKTAADVLEHVQRAGEFGIAAAGNAKPDMPALMLRKNEVVRGQVQGLLRLFKQLGIRHVSGHGSIEGSGRLSVTLPEGGREEIPWDRLILATGSIPAQLKGLPFNGKTVLSSNHVLSLQTLPESVVIVGGGVIGCEFASILAGLGVRVTVVEAMDRLLPLPGVDEACARTLAREMKKRKIKVVLSAGVTGFQERNGRPMVMIGPSPFEGNAAREQTARVESIDAACVIACIGRRPDTEGLGLERLGLTPEPEGWIRVDDRMRTVIPDVYAVGDILGPQKLMLAHVAATEGRLAAENALGMDRRMRYDVVPSAVFTSPEIGVVGLTEREAKEAGFIVKTESVLFRTIGKAHVLGKIAGEAKLVLEEETGRILGAHLVGAGATDIVAEAALAIRTGCTVKDVADTIHAHPTLAEILFEVAGNACGMPLHRQGS